jgi:hypothetical protein
LLDFRLPRQHVQITCLHGAIDADAQRQRMLVLMRERDEVYIAQHLTIISSPRPTFTNSRPPLRIIGSPGACGPDCGFDEALPAECQTTGAFMQATGEFIRLLNYVDDIAATLRRVHVAVPTLSAEERKRLAEYMRKSDPNFIAVLESLEKGEK